MNNSHKIPAWYPQAKKKKTKRFRFFFFFLAVMVLMVFFVSEKNGEWGEFRFSPTAFGLEEGSDDEDIYAITVSSHQGEVLGKEEVREDILARDTRVTAEQFVPFGVATPRAKDDGHGLSVYRAHASVMIDVASGTLLHFENANEKRQVASITKMMTALLVMEEGNMDDVVTITEEMLNVEGTVVGCPRSGYCIDTRLQVGEKIRVRDLMKAMLMNSANDAATSLAFYMDGSVEQFSERMNRRARDLRLSNSYFCTPSGLEIEGKECYSSAYDIARIATETMKYDEIWEIMNLPSGTVISSVDGAYTHEILNTNALLGEYDGLVGAKTGFTPDAGYSLMAAAVDSEGNNPVIAVVLDDPYRWEDIQEMFSWVFSVYEWE